MHVNVLSVFCKQFCQGVQWSYAELWNRTGLYGVKITPQHVYDISQCKIYVSVLLNLLKSTSTMLELGDKFKHYTFFDQIPFLM